MIQPDKERLIHFYQEALAEYGAYDARSVHWSELDSQQRRFFILSQVADLNGKSVLDVGSGLGDLYAFFLRQKIDVDYTGIDIVPDFIEKARMRFPMARFELQDISDTTEQYDYILASGALSFKVADNKNFYFSLIKKMYDCVKIGVAFNMLNHASHIDNDIYASYDPTEVADFCKTFCSDVEIVIDYLPQDFTIYLYKERS